MADVKNPLGPDQLKTLNELLASCAASEEYMAKCEAAFVDVSRERRENAEQAKIAQAMKAQFFPMER